MKRAKSTPTRILSTIATALAIVVAVVLPIGYYGVAHRNASLQLEATASNLALVVNRIVLENPKAWKFLSHFDSILQRNIHEQGVAARVVDSESQVIASAGPPAAWPSLQRSATVFDSGSPVGKVIVERGLNELVRAAAIAAVLGLALGGAIFVAVRVLPVRALDRLLADLNAARDDAEHKAAALDEARRELEAKVLERTAELERANEAVTAARQAAELRALQLEGHNREITIVSQMLEMLQVTRSFDEAEQVIAAAAVKLFPQERGALYLFNDSRTVLEARARWGAVIELVVFPPDECWAVRRGQPHEYRAETALPRCKHAASSSRATVCLPLTAQGEMLGIVHLDYDGAAPGQDEFRTRVETFTDRLGLAISNLRLRESLKSLSIRDSLTGLFNRRYMEEALETELNRAQRNQTRVAVIMLDADHFKRVNDLHGHEAGDTVLREIGVFLKGAIRAGDIACRYGGEEFCLILPNSDLAAATERAEAIRRSVTRLDLKIHGTPLGQITFSLGVAAYPEHAASAGALLTNADAALYRAKHSGRNRVCVFESPVTG